MSFFKSTFTKLVYDATSSQLAKEDLQLSFNIVDLINDRNNPVCPKTPELIQGPLSKRFHDKRLNVKNLTLIVIGTIVKNCGRVGHEAIFGIGHLLEDIFKSITSIDDYEYQSNALALVGLWHTSFYNIKPLHAPNWLNRFNNLFSKIQNSGYKIPQLNQSELLTHDYLTDDKQYNHNIFDKPQQNQTSSILPPQNITKDTVDMAKAQANMTEEQIMAQIAKNEEEDRLKKEREEKEHALKLREDLELEAAIKASMQEAEKVVDNEVDNKSAYPDMSVLSLGKMNFDHVEKSTNLKPDRTIMKPSKIVPNIVETVEITDYDQDLDEELVECIVEGYEHTLIDEDDTVNSDSEEDGKVVSKKNLATLIVDSDQNEIFTEKDIKFLKDFKQNMEILKVRINATNKRGIPIQMDPIGNKLLEDLARKQVKLNALMQSITQKSKKFDDMQNKLNEISENRLFINQQRLEARQQAEAEKIAAAEKARADRAAKLDRIRSTKNNFLAQRKMEIYSKIRMSVKDHGQFQVNGQFQNGQTQSSQFQNSQAQNGHFQSGQVQSNQFQNGQVQSAQYQNPQSQNGQFTSGHGQNELFQKDNFTKTDDNVVEEKDKDTTTDSKNAKDLANQNQFQTFPQNENVPYNMHQNYYQQQNFQNNTDPDKDKQNFYQNQQYYYQNSSNFQNQFPNQTFVPNQTFNQFPPYSPVISNVEYQPNYPVAPTPSKFSSVSDPITTSQIEEKEEPKTEFVEDLITF